MKTAEEIYLDEVKRASELDERFGKILMSDAIRKFTLNCLMKMESQFRQLPVINAVCPNCGSSINNIEHKGNHAYCHQCDYEWNWA